MSRLSSVIIILAILSTLLGGPSTPVQAQANYTEAETSFFTTTQPKAALQALGFSKTSIHTQTGKVRFFQPGDEERTIRPASLKPESPPVQAAFAYLDSYGSQFGIEDPQNQLQVKEETIVPEATRNTARSLVRYQQVHRGVPVMGGEIIVQMDQDNYLLSINGEILPDIQVETQAVVTSQAAEQSAILSMAKNYQLDIDNFQATKPELWIYDPRILGGAGNPISRLVWQIEITSPLLLDLRELVLIDAVSGNLVLNFNQIHTIKQRLVYDHNNIPSAYLPGTTPARVEGGAGTGIPDIDLAYDYAGLTYDFYFDVHGRDSIDGHGMSLVNTVRYCPPGGSCPYANAFWNSTQMVYGTGYAAADDVVAHELTHGVTEYESGLYYYMQSGAINEAFSDIWGEFVDLTYDTASDNDDPSVRWKMGEDIPISAIRDMSNPPAFGDPDKMSSPLYYCSLNDSGGVHTNSGVANKAASLLVDGGNFNGQTISAIGITKTAKIFYEVQTNLFTSASDYQDLGDALVLACDNLKRDGVTTESDCAQVSKTVYATEMHLQPGACSAAPTPVCDLVLFSSSFDNMSGWTPVTGSWNTIGGYLTTEGIANNTLTSIATDISTGDSTFEVSLRRSGSDNNTHGLILHGDPSSIYLQNSWESAYYFQFNNDQEVSVLKSQAGIITALMDWVSIPYVISYGFNTLKVTSQGSTLYFYINDKLTWSGIDESFRAGKAGIFLYRDTVSAGDLLEVDYASIQGGTPLYSFKDNLENPISGNWLSSVDSGSTNPWFYPQSLYVDGEDNQYATSGEYNFLAINLASTNDANMALNNPLQLPAGTDTYLRFNHAYQFETGAFDGGVLEYSTGGPWIDAGSLFVNKGYSGTLNSGNPLGARSAFVNDSNGMIASRLLLTPLAGEDVRFRFRQGTDSIIGSWGWYIDDIEVYTCQASVQSTFLPAVIKPGTPDPAFHDAFTSSDGNWEIENGNWALDGGYMATEIPALNLNSISREFDSLNFDYSVRLRRTGCSSCATGVIVRGNPDPLDAFGAWRDGYAMLINNNGEFTIFFFNDGSLTVLQNWTASSAINQGYDYQSGGWNIIRVVGNGNTLTFYVNGTMVSTGNDPNPVIGKLGVLVYGNGSWNLGQLDWAQAVPLP